MDQRGARLLLQVGDALLEAAQVLHVIRHVRRKNRLGERVGRRIVFTLPRFFFSRPYARVQSQSALALSAMQKFEN